MTAPKNIILTSLAPLALGLTAYSAEPPRSELGQGIAVLKGGTQLRDQCIRFSPQKVRTEEVRATSYKLTLLRTKEELSDRLEINTSASGGFASFGASAKFRFVREIEWDANSTYILVQASRITRKQSLDEGTVLLESRAADVLRDSPFRFNEACGQGFATTVELGGEVFGLIEIHSDSYLEKQQVESFVKGSGSLGSLASVSGRGSYERAIRTLTEHYRAKVTFQHLGGSRVTVPTTPEGLIELSGNIEALSDAFPVPLNVLTRDYSTLRNAVMDENDPEIQVRQTELDWATGKLEEARRLYANMLYVLEYPKDFKSFDEGRLKSQLAYVDGKILELRNFIARGSRFSNETDLSQLSLDLDIQLPKKRWLVSRRESRVSCEVKQSRVCGVAKYETRASSACGIVAPLEGTGPVCGTTYKKAQSPACGVALFKESTGPACGIQGYKTCLMGGNRFPFRGRKKVTHPSCGVEYKTCRDASFGIQAFNECRNPAHGIERYETCRDKEFGYEFQTCAHFSHGPAEYKSCEVARIGDQETFCPSL